MKVGEHFPPPHFLKGVFAAWLLVQAGVAVWLWLRRRRLSTNTKTD